ncbi:hypothetical protein BASA81_002154 [Batrachochytrium salamandrivorans]|nr:hypothetical protein BASA81_002154 [Batrachochytrium salamandrivorans]
MQEKRTRVLTSGRFGSVANYRVRYIWFNPDDPGFLRYSFFDDFRKIRVLPISAKDSEMTARENVALDKPVLEDFTLQWRISFNRTFHLYFAGRNEFNEWTKLLEAARLVVTLPDLPSTVSNKVPAWYEQELAKNNPAKPAQPITNALNNQQQQQLPGIQLNLSLPMQFIAVALPLGLGHFKLWFQHDHLTLARLKQMVAQSLRQGKLSSLKQVPLRQAKYQAQCIQTLGESHGFCMLPLPLAFDLGPAQKHKLVLNYSAEALSEPTAAVLGAAVWLEDEQVDVSQLLASAKPQQYCLHLVPKRNFPPSTNSAWQIKLMAVDKEYDALSKFNTYLLHVQFANAQWQVKRRFSDLRLLHANLKPAMSLPLESSKQFESELHLYLFCLAGQFPNALPLLEFVGVLSVAPSSSQLPASVTIPLQSLDQYVQCGDVVLFRSVNPMSGMQRNVLQCEYDHVGLVVKRSRHGYELLEATGEGVTSFPLEDRIYAYSKGFCDKIAVLKARFTRTPLVLHKLVAFTNRVEGKPYKLSLARLARGQFEVKQQQPVESTGLALKREYFCSELVAEALRAIGFFHPQSTKREDYFLPHYFETSASLAKFTALGCSFENRLQVVDCVRPEILAMTLV